MMENILERLCATGSSNIWPDDISTEYCWQNTSVFSLNNTLLELVTKGPVTIQSTLV